MEIIIDVDTIESIIEDYVVNNYAKTLGTMKPSEIGITPSIYEDDDKEKKVIDYSKLLRDVIQGVAIRRIDQ